MNASTVVPAALLSGLWLLAAAPAEADAPPRLVLLLVVDQLRPDDVGSDLPGGLGRLVREGRRFADAAHDHAPTETCPGHATIVTGRRPGAAGLPANVVFDRAGDRVRYCVEDGRPEALTLEGGEGRSPRALRVSTLGDWLKAAHPTARVFALSGKDRAAVVLGGHAPDGVYWLATEGEPRFTTSRAYRESAPAWLRRFNGDATGGTPLLARVPDAWRYEPASGPRRDAHPAEDPGLSASSPHPVGGRDPSGNPALLFTPYVDELTIDLARLVIHQEGLGTDAVPDLVALSLSGTDWIGHRYGPESQEAHHARRRLDRALGELLDGLVERSGRDGLLVVLSSDHGVLPIPEWLEETGRSECPVAGGRLDARELAGSLETRLAARFGAPSGSEPWMRVAGAQLLVNRVLAEQHEVDPAEVAAEAKALLEASPGIARVWTYEELAAAAGPAPFARLYRNGFDRERSGDLIVQPARDCLVSRYPHGTHHGSPYTYDRAVPLVFWGAGVEPGTVRGRAAPVDIAPTLARELGLAPPEGLDGRLLGLRSASPSL